MEAMTRLIGIDFGTSTSIVKVKRYRNALPEGDAFLTGAVTFGNGEADNKAVTLVRENPDGSYTCGRDAEGSVQNSSLYREFKMDLESPEAEKRQKARELTEAYFRYLYSWYDHQRSDLGELTDEEETLISYPVKWQAETRQFMLRAAEKAGFPRVSAMDEASAALYACLARKMGEIRKQGLLRNGEEGYMLLVDMGAGTTDLALCRYRTEAGTDGLLHAEQIHNEIISVYPEKEAAPTFGGREVDKKLAAYVSDYLLSCGMQQKDAAIVLSGDMAVKRWKENEVSFKLNGKRPVDSCGFVCGYTALLPESRPFPAFERKDFEALLHYEIESFKALVRGCLYKAKKAHPDFEEKGLDLVILTGGHSSWYFTKELLDGSMKGLSHPLLERVQAEKERVVRLSNPQETVSLGLVYSKLPFRLGGEAKKAEEPLKQPPKQPETARAQGDNVVKFPPLKKEKPDTAPKQPPRPEAPKTELPKPRILKLRNIDLEVYPSNTWCCNYRIQKHVKAYIASVSPALLNRLFEEKSKKVMARRIDFKDIGEFYLAHDDTVLGTGGNGHVISSVGIVCKPSLSLAEAGGVNWREFLHGSFAAPTGPQIGFFTNTGEFRYLAQYGIMNKEIREDAFRFLKDMQKYLREHAERMPEKEVFPTGTFFWDPSMLRHVEDFLQKKEKEDRDYYQKIFNAKFPEKMRSALSVGSDRLYAVRDDSLLKNAKNGFAITSGGIANHCLLKKPVLIPWSVFLHGYVVPTFSSILLEFETNGSVNCILATANTDIKEREMLVEFFQQLQSYLRGFARR